MGGTHPHFASRSVRRRLPHKQGLPGLRESSTVIAVPCRSRLAKAGRPPSSIDWDEPGTNKRDRSTTRVDDKVRRWEGLTHTYTVCTLETGVNIREIQTRLGHASVRTAMLYQQCLAPERATSPLDTMNEPPTTPHGTTPRPEIAHPRQAYGDRKTNLSRLARWFRNRLGLSSA
jgi:hypothetical protein